MSNVTIGAGTKYIISRGHTFQMENQPEVTGNFDAFLLFVGVQIFVFDL
jgi:hypothetical protein